MIQPTSRDQHDKQTPSERFLESDRKHVLMITNHGIHQWHVNPGLPDTGGQNVYVNQFTEALVELGFRVTIVNRGGYKHPQSGQMQCGVSYHPTGYARILYLEDGRHEFVRKEDMNEQLPALAEDLQQKLKEDGLEFELIISHYWDAAKLGTMINRGDNRKPHVWIPHSLGALKKKNMDPSTWANLRIDERIEHEKELIPELDGCIATSSAIRETFREDYGVESKFFLPPCILTERIHPMDEHEIDPVWEFLADHSKHTAEEIRQRPIVAEVSRTDETKRKDVLIQAFARAKQHVPEALLVVSIDKHSEKLYAKLTALIERLELSDDVIVLGSVWEQLPMIYNAMDVFCTPSVMEGFGMTAQEAAASGKPVISSDLVPFVVEYLLGPEAIQKKVRCNGDEEKLIFGEGAIVVPADCVPGFGEAIRLLLSESDRARAMGRKAFDITIPYFTWKRMAASLMEDLGIGVQAECIELEDMAEMGRSLPTHPEPRGKMQVGELSESEEEVT